MVMQRPDSLVRDEIVRALGSSSDTSQVLIQFADGAVTLSGDVPSAEIKRQTQAMVEAIDGVRGVHNLINVDSGTASFGARGAAVRDNPDGEDAARDGELDLRQDG